MTLGEGSIINGTGSQTAGGNRWGDYTAIVLDPSDDMTFWFISEYVPTTSAAGWRLRIGAFNLAGGGSPTPTPTASPTSTPTSTPTATPSGCQYTFTTGTDTIVPGTVDTGNHTDDGDTFVALPFSFSLYDQTYNGVNVSSNGRLDFVCINEPGGYMAACLPPPDNQCPFDYTIFAWSDFNTGVVGEGCSNFASGCGIFTSVSGTAPNRIFNIEWRAVYFADHTQTANFEIRLYENNPNKRFDLIFGTVQPGSDQLYVSGVQGAGRGLYSGLLRC